MYPNLLRRHKAFIFRGIPLLLKNYLHTSILNVKVLFLVLPLLRKKLS